jgi:hypothetical protein
MMVSSAIARKNLKEPLTSINHSSLIVRGESSQAKTGAKNENAAQEQ